MTTDKTSLGDWARERSKLAVKQGVKNADDSRGECGTYECVEFQVEAAIIEGMVAALDRASKPLGCLSCLSPDSLRLELGCVNPGCDNEETYESGIEALKDALKKELRGNDVNS